MVKPVAGYRPLAYSSPEAVQTTGTVADVVKFEIISGAFLGVRLRQLQLLCSTEGTVSSPPSDRFLRIAFGQSGGWSIH